MKGGSHALNAGLRRVALGVKRFFRTSTPQGTQSTMATVTKQQELDDVSRISAIHRARVNVKSLAAEARFIRQEEQRCGQEFRNDLASHRRGRLRDEARYAQLALAFFRRRSYRTVEGKCDAAPFVGRLHEKAKRLNWRVTVEMIQQWLGE